MKPLAVDLFCGLGGWTEGLLAEGYDVIGFDVERHAYGDARYPAQLVLQDVLTLDGAQFKGATLIVASPPCQEYSYMAMPWSRAKAIAAEYRSGARDVRKLTALFDACFRIQREACEAAGKHIPLVVENVRGACPWVGRSRWNFGSFHLWGDVPALMPMAKRIAKRPGHDWNRFNETGEVSPHWRMDEQDSAKNPGFRFDGSGRSFQSESVDRHTKNTGGSWFNIAHNTTSGCGQNPDGRKTVGHVNKRDGHGHTRHPTNQRESDAVKNGGDWFNSSQPSEQRRHGSGTNARKAASAMIAKIPLPLSRHIAAVYRHVDAHA